jgi:hypothetical protein
MAVIKALEKTYMLKSVGITEALKNQGLGLALSAKTYIQNAIPKSEGISQCNFSPSRHP